MTMHETLGFVGRLHDWMADELKNPGPWCWPTRELLSANLRLNRHLFSGEVVTSNGTNLTTAKRRGWILDGGCGSHCHARHITLTANGLEVLKLMDESGCSRFRQECQHPALPPLRLTRRAA
jgi:hypothetical protein